MKKKIVEVILMVAVACSCLSCGRMDSQQGTNSDIKSQQIGIITEPDTPKEGTVKQPETETDEEVKVSQITSEDFKDISTAFGLELFKDCYASDKNVMISPLSVMAAMSMTANGADGETLSQMEDVLGQGTDMQTLNQRLSAYMKELPASKDAKVSTANSIWFTDDEKLTVNQDFLKQNQHTYQAEIYRTSFHEQTVKDINIWVSDNTDGMVKDILDRVPEEAIMYLINAVAFDARWQNQYLETQVHEQTFTTEAGEERQVPMMFSEENRYIEDELATGFCKPYKEGYSFVALLPKEGISVEEYVNSLETESFRDMITKEEDVEVYAAIPKFSAEYTVDMKDILKAAGMNNAFDENTADFSGLGTYQDGNIFISRVLHKTYIDVDEDGTRAGAATVVEMIAESAMMKEEESKTVILDRPFVYAIIDNENQLPIFIGSVMEIQ